MYWFLFMSLCCCNDSIIWLSDGSRKATLFRSWNWTSSLLFQFRAYFGMFLLWSKWHVNKSLVKNGSLLGSIPRHPSDSCSYKGAEDHHGLKKKMSDKLPQPWFEASLFGLQPPVSKYPRDNPSTHIFSFHFFVVGGKYFFYHIGGWPKRLSMFISYDSDLIGRMKPGLVPHGATSFQSDLPSKSQVFHRSKWQPGCIKNLHLVKL